MIKILFSLVVLLFFSSSYAQNGTNLNADTPPEVVSPAPATTTVPVPTAPTDITTSSPTVTTPVVTTPTTTDRTTPGITTTTTVTTMTPNTLFTCSGMGPNWNLDMSKTSITFSSSVDKNMIIKSVTPLAPTGAMAGSLLVYSTTTADNRPITMLIRKNDLGCPMDPSGTSKFDAIIILPDKVLAGCCTVKPGI